MEMANNRNFSSVQFSSNSYAHAVIERFRYALYSMVYMPSQSFAIPLPVLSCKAETFRIF